MKEIENMPETSQTHNLNAMTSRLHSYY